MVPVACVSRAPTDCELDKRAGSYPSSFCDNGAAQSNLPNSIHSEGNTVPKKPMTIPVREAPLVKKIWVPDQILEGGHWMQGTWLFVEVEPSKWVGAVSAVTQVESSALGSKSSLAKAGLKNNPTQNPVLEKPSTPAKSSSGGAQ